MPSASTLFPANKVIDSCQELDSRPTKPILCHGPQDVIRGSCRCSLLSQTSGLQVRNCRFDMRAF